MKKIVLISCVSKKRRYKCQARDLYTSPLFEKSLEYAQRLNPDAIFVLSAKHGLLDLDTEVEPYDATLNHASARHMRAWADNVLKQLSERADLRRDHFILLAGLKYRRHLIPHLASYEVPLEGLTIGRQLQRLSKRSHEPDLL